MSTSNTLRFTSWVTVCAPRKELPNVEVQHGAHLVPRVPQHGHAPVFDGPRQGHPLRQQPRIPRNSGWRDGSEQATPRHLSRDLRHSQVHERIGRVVLQGPGCPLRKTSYLCRNCQDARGLHRHPYGALLRSSRFYSPLTGSDAIWSSFPGHSTASRQTVVRPNGITSLVSHVEFYQPFKIEMAAALAKNVN